MNLNNHTHFKKLDTQDMLAAIDGLPEQLETAWELGQGFAPPPWENIDRVLIAGMGGSAIGASLLAAYVAPLCEVPVFVHRDYDLPAWAKGQGTLVITSSHSGNTEETLSAFEAALENGCRILAVTTGGKIAAKAKEHKTGLWQFDHDGQPRAAVGYSFGLLLAAFSRLGFIPDQADEIRDAVRAMVKQQKSVRSSVPLAKNPAKALAGHLTERWVSVFGAGLLAPVARRWKGQISELAKAWAQFEALPEADHNTLAGVVNPQEKLAKTKAIFLRADANHPRNQLRIGLTEEGMSRAGMETTVINTHGDTRLAQLWATLHLGDYVAYYLAMTYGVDPSPVAAIEDLKRALAAFD
ncbi:MAG: hypothetical protein MAG431_00108 [Chloroflexi bacterium]|nr:hypothetical protein [Chloroflexota bacterium]